VFDVVQLKLQRSENHYWSICSTFLFSLRRINLLKTLSEFGMLIMKFNPEKKQLILALTVLFIFCLHLNGEVLNPEFLDSASLDGYWLKT
jgi:hypothetical protein